MAKNSHPSRLRHKRPMVGEIRSFADRFERQPQALGKGTVARVASERASRAGASPTITIRLAEDDLTRARTFAAEKGLRYQTYLKMLLHQALTRRRKAPSVATGGFLYLPC